LPEEKAGEKVELLNQTVQMSARHLSAPEHKPHPQSSGTGEHEVAIDELTAEALEPPRILRALRHVNFRKMWVGNFLSNIGTFMQNVAQGWLVLELTNSAYWLGVVSFAAAAPMLVFGLIGGVIADHLDRRKLLIATQIASMLSAFVLAALVFSHTVQVWHVIACAFVTGVASALGAPSQQALLPMLVPREDITNAVGLNSAQFNLSRVLGPTIGGFSMAIFGSGGNFLLNGLSFLALIIALMQVKLPEMVVPHETDFWIKLKEGFRYTLADRRLRELIEVVIVGSLFGVPYLSFVPYFARDVLHVGERGLGILMAFSGLGAFIAAVTVAYLGRFRQRGMFILVNGVMCFVAIIGFTFSRNFLLSGLLQMVAGFCLILMVAAINTRLQLLASDVMRGRVMSIYTSCYLGLPPLGSYLAGHLSKWISPAHAIAGMAAVGIVGISLIFAVRSELRTLD